MNNTACHPILEVVPRVCGAEKGKQNPTTLRERLGNVNVNEGSWKE